MIDLSRQVEDAVIQGARVIMGGTQAFDPDSYTAIFFEPTVIADVENDMEVTQNETNGPIVTLQ